MHQREHSLNKIHKGTIWSIPVMTICVLMFAVLVFLVGVMPVHAETMDEAGSCQPYPGHNQAPAPLCCYIADYPVSYSCTINVLPSPNRLTLAEVSPFMAPRTDYSLARQKPLGRDMIQGLFLPSGADFRCRNSLESEEPPLF